MVIFLIEITYSPVKLKASYLRMFQYPQVEGKMAQKYVTCFFIDQSSTKKGQLAITLEGY